MRIPGPTPLPREVRKAVSQQMINHRGKSYEEIQQGVIKNLQYFFQTENEIFLLTCSGMGGLEAAIVNFFSQGDKLVFFTCGEFGNRFAEIGRRFGGNVIQTKFELGKAVSKNKVSEVLKENPDVKGVFFTHNETATGVLNPIAELTPLIKNHKNKPLIIVDSISALGAVSLPMDDLGIDVVVTASQKAWMAPPGLCMMAVSKKAWSYIDSSDLPKYYFDLRMYHDFNLKNQTPATPAVSTILGLDESLKMMRKEGKEKIFQRHIDFRNYLRKELWKIHLRPYVDEEIASPTVTSIEVPPGVDSHKWLEIMNKKYGVILAGGMGETKGKIIRVAHMGYVNKQDLDQVIEVLERSLREIK